MPVLFAPEAEEVNVFSMDEKEEDVREVAPDALPALVLWPEVWLLPGEKPYKPRKNCAILRSAGHYRDR